MADTLRVSIHGARIAAAVALDCAGYIAEHPHTTNADIAVLLGINPSQMSDAKKGYYQIRAEHAVIMARFGMTRTLAVMNEIATEGESRGDVDLAFHRTMAMFQTASETVRVTVEALNDRKVTAAEKETCLSRLLDLQNATSLLIRAMRAMKVSNE